MKESLLSLALELLTIHTLGIIAAGHAIMNTRTAQGAMAWAVALVALPYFSLIPYLFLGRSRFAGYVDHHRFNSARASARTDARVGQSEVILTARRDAAATPELHRFLAVDRLGGRQFVAGNHLHLLRDGEATFQSIFEAIDRAQHYVLVQFFIVEDDELGRELARRLIARAAAGVKVHFLYDGIGSYSLPKRYVTELEAAGIEIHAFSVRRFRNRFQLNFRNHRKIVVVDGEVGFVGGLNVGVEYLGKHKKLSPWRDTHLRLEGPVVAQIQRTFSEDWYWVTQNVPLVRPPRGDVGKVTCLAVASGPADLQETGSLFFVQAIHAAERRIWIATPYFVPDSAVLAALRLAVMRGIDVRIIMPSRADHRTVYLASLFHAYEMARAGVRIFRYLPGFMHQKVMLIDDNAAAVGSANMDNRSFRLNFEITVLAVDPGFAGQVEAMLHADLNKSSELEPREWQQVPLATRILTHLARLFAPVL